MTKLLTTAVIRLASIQLQRDPVAGISAGRQLPANDHETSPCSHSGMARHRGVGCGVRVVTQCVCISHPCCKAVAGGSSDRTQAIWRDAEYARGSRSASFSRANVVDDICRGCIRVAKAPASCKRSRRRARCRCSVWTDHMARDVAGGYSGCNGETATLWSQMVGSGFCPSAVRDVSSRVHRT